MSFFSTPWMGKEMCAAIVLWSSKFAEEFLSLRELRHGIFGTLFCLAGCALSPLDVGKATVAAETAGFVAKTFSAGEFKLFALQKVAPDPGPILTVYIEGDGRSWRRRNQPSADPTPRHSVALALAMQDPVPAVLYLARPCQFQPQPLPSECDVSVWTSHRYSETVITAMNAAINEAAAGFEQVALVGYSGGGTVAALVAARRQDVAWMITVAANLDHRAWTELHGVSPLTGSLNAADFAHAVERIPQLHLVGGKDKTVPLAVIQSFLDQMSDGSRAQVKVEPEFDHDCCWEIAWPKIIGIIEDRPQLFSKDVYE
jgi:pimeloyl-ACP methyl ester carboxylesterase